ncbi:MAG: ribonuclease R, partial [Lachnoclostridium sp.]|nr:ribonuclease R [Lachnoclostridium sp.]
MDNQNFNRKKEIIYEFISSKDYRPMKKKVLADLLQVPRQDRKQFSKLLSELEIEGKITYSEKGKIMIPEGNIRTGVFSATKKGYGFVIVEGEEDIFIPDGCCKEAFDGDIVLVKLSVQKRIGSGRLRDGIITRIIERKNNQIVGTFESSVGFGFVIPDDKKLNYDLFIPQKHTNGAATGHKVVVKITDFGDEMNHPEGEVIEILGHKNDPGVDILSVLKSLGISDTFDEKVIKQTQKIPEEVTEQEMQGRMDIRNTMTVTIDGEDAKDLDDAITLSQSEDGIYHLGVHIADVTHYVKERSAIDKEAIKRGTSVYLADRVVPMLPYKLSNGICSLNAGVDRLALSCFMDLNQKGEITNHQIAETVIHVDERMSYTDVNALLTKESQELHTRYKELLPMFSLMEDLAERLRKARKKNGSIDFDLPESQIIMDEDGTV